MAMRAVRLGSVVFTYPLWVAESFAGSGVVSKTYRSAAQTDIVFETRVATPAITLESREYGWISQQNMTDLLVMWDQLGGEWELEYDDGSTVLVRIARENPMKFEPLFEGSDHYHAEIHVAILRGV